MSPRKNGPHFADDIFVSTFMFLFKFQRIMSLRVQSTICQHRFRMLDAEQVPSHYLNQWWLSLFTHTLQWRHNGVKGVSNHQHHACLLNRLFRRRSKKTYKLGVTGICGIHRWPPNSPHKGPLKRMMFPFDDVIMHTLHSASKIQYLPAEAMIFINHNAERTS